MSVRVCLWRGSHDMHMPYTWACLAHGHAPRMLSLRAAMAIKPVALHPMIAYSPSLAVLPSDSFSPTVPTILSALLVGSICQRCEDTCMCIRRSDGAALVCVRVRAHATRVHATCRCLCAYAYPRRTWRALSCTCARMHVYAFMCVHAIPRHESSAPSSSPPRLPRVPNL